MSLTARTHLDIPNGFNAFLQAIAHQPLLSPEEERAAATKLRHKGDRAAAQLLVMSNMRFVVHVARGYQGYGLPIEDLVQQGAIGLMQAIRRFDPSWGVRLITYAVHWIKASISDFILCNFRIVRHVTTKAQRKLFFNLRKLKRSAGPLSNEEAESIAQALDVPVQDVRKSESLFTASDRSIHAVDDETAPEHWLQAEGADPSIVAENDDWHDKMRPRLNRALTSLDSRSRDIVMNRTLSDDGKKGLSELGSKYGISAERVRQIEVKAFRCLRDSVAGATA